MLEENLTIDLPSLDGRLGPDKLEGDVRAPCRDSLRRNNHIAMEAVVPAGCERVRGGLDQSTRTSPFFIK